MLFNSISFLIFLPTVFILYWFIFNKSLQLQNLLILVASYFFYGFWSWKFMFLLFFSTLLDYVYGFYVASPNKLKSKFFLWLSIINNIGILVTFKYFNFFIIQIQHSLNMLGLSTNPFLLNIAVPVGISFYTFHGMSYIFDIYLRKQKPVKNFIEYSVFVSFFPLLVAGPIERANHLLPQFKKKRKFNYLQAVEGCRLILWGMVKKVVIADSLAIFVNDIFTNFQNYNAYTLLLGSVAFSFQIYGDFSGYSDIALGTAKLFGFELLSNFKFPYFSRNIAEFWRRWHISLSSWFRDYLYIPLGGSKFGKLKTVRNIFLIFIISGFWHGASWNYIVWGIIHACGFLPSLILNTNRKYLSEIVAQDRKLPNFKELCQMIFTFIFVTFGWIFFRSNSVEDALSYLNRIKISLFQFPKQFVHIPAGLTIFLYIIPLVLCDWWLRRDERILKYPNNRIFRQFFYFVLMLLIYFSFRSNNSFIYFQF